ncbi:MAG: ATP-binding cassette domain-containing protein [Synergistetes bacterium]|nr:ATP-binding cassette domain-containing protein [Synergistota bacterium]
MRKSYGDLLVFEGLDLEFHLGEISVLIGPSGCGKTTLLRVIAGLERPDRGEVIVPFEKIGFLFQDDRLFP